MARKIFVSYKYNDARSYVDKLEETLNEDHIYKGESDDEDLSYLAEDTIKEKLKNRIYDSSITVVFISENMIDPNTSEKEQWMPWEISYSLKEMTRGDRTSATNAVLAVVIPDRNGWYDYFITHRPCVTTWHTDRTFKIVGSNMFNRHVSNQQNCHICYGIHHVGGDHSYIHPVKWKDFISNVNHYIDHAVNIKEKQHEYNITKEIPE